MKAGEGGGGAGVGVFEKHSKKSRRVAPPPPNHFTRKKEKSGLEGGCEGGKGEIRHEMHI